MLSSKLNFFLLLASSSYAAALHPRNVQLADDIYEIDAAVNVLTGNVNAYTSGTFPTGTLNDGPIFLDVINIHLVKRKG
jgi:hypothetical protein